MEPYQQRVVEELKEIEGRREKICAFLESEKGKQLPEAEKRRMTRQYFILNLYELVLEERIANFPVPV